MVENRSKAGAMGATGRRKYDFFDVDHTIIRGSSGVLFLLKGARLGVFPLWILAYIPFFFLQYSAGRLWGDPREWHFPVLAGRSFRELEEVSRSSFRRMKTLVYPQARALIEALRGQGRTVVLATSSLDLIVRPLAKYLGIEEVIATTLEFDGDRCTGRFAEQPLFKDKKREKVYDFIQSRGASWQDCSFYTDSVHDIALLESVADPVAVNPDRRLRGIAKRRGWRIVKFHRRSS
jgi:HAD superfamily hydrolase (TIGR01490 family)